MGLGMGGLGRVPYRAVEDVLDRLQQSCPALGRELARPGGLDRNRARLHHPRRSGSVGEVLTDFPGSSKGQLSCV